LADHWGRKPMAVTGAAIGVSMWQTTSQVIVADMSTPENRGRAVATRNTTLRLGQIIGPLLGGIVAGLVSLQAVFFINAASKFIVMIVTWRMVKETRPELETAKANGNRPPSSDAEPSLSMWSIMASRPFVALVHHDHHRGGHDEPGRIHDALPHRQQRSRRARRGADRHTGRNREYRHAPDLFPNGVLVDRFGRKRSLVPGLLLAGVAAALLALVVDFRTALQAAAVFGIAQSMTQGANQTYAMDLAPEDRRGAFLGMWTSFQSFGAFIGPLAVGATVEIWGFATAFYGVAVVMAFVGLAMGVLGPETRSRSGNR